MATEDSINNSGIPQIEFDLTPVSNPPIAFTVQAGNTITQPTDKTLTTEGQPADAKATGDAIAEVQANLADLALEVSQNTDGIADLNDDLEDYVPKADIDTMLATSGKVADSKATGDAIDALREEITGMIDTTLTVSGGIADAEATGEAISDAIDTARDGVVLVTQQSLTSAEQAQARVNIGAADLQRVNVISASGVTSLPYTITDESITVDMVVVNSVLSNPAAQMCDWTVGVTNGSLTIDKAGLGTGIGYGGTDITLYLAKTGSSVAQTSTIKHEYAISPTGLYYSRTFEPSDANSIFASNVTSGRIQVYKAGQNISVRMQNVTFNAALAAGSTFLIATLPENCRILLMQQAFFHSGNNYHGSLSVAAGTGEITISAWDTSIPAGTSIVIFMPLFNVSRDHDDQDVTGFTLVTPS